MFVFASATPKPFIDKLVLVKPLNIEVWIWYLFSMFALSFIVSFVSRAEDNLFKVTKKERCSSVTGALWLLYGTSFSQGIIYGTNGEEALTMHSGVVKEATRYDTFCSQNLKNVPLG
jgi:hypothetical protein